MKSFIIPYRSALQRHSIQFRSIIALTKRFHFLRMSRISKRERFFIAAWFECHGSVSVVQRKFREKFGRHAQLPCSATIHRIHQRAAETGDLDDEPRPGRRRSSEDILRVEEDVKEEPQMSIRVRARKLHLSRSNMHRILRDDLRLHPYRPRLLQELSEEDFAHRMTFCEEMVELLENDANLLDRFVFTDEAHFHLCGNVNRHNLRYYAKENPNFFLTQPFHSSRVTVWAGVWAGGFLGPFFSTKRSPAPDTWRCFRMLFYQCFEKSRNSTIIALSGNRMERHPIGTGQPDSGWTNTLGSVRSAETDRWLGHRAVPT